MKLMKSITELIKQLLLKQIRYFTDKIYIFFCPCKENLTDIIRSSPMEIHWNATTDVRWMSQCSGEGIDYKESSSSPAMDDAKQSPV